jgi:hypothetical protein
MPALPPLPAIALPELPPELHIVAPQPAGALPDDRPGPAAAESALWSGSLADLDARSRLQEHRFRSRVPVLGPLIAGLRSLWNAVSTRWYVLPLMHQQSDFNLMLVHRLRVYEQLFQSLQARLAAFEALAARQGADIQALQAARDAHAATLEAQTQILSAQAGVLLSHAGHLRSYAIHLEAHAALLADHTGHLANHAGHLADQEAQLQKQEGRLLVQHDRLEGHGRRLALQARRLDVHEGVLDDLLAGADLAAREDAASASRALETRLAELGRTLVVLEQRLAQVEAERQA